MNLEFIKKKNCTSLRTKNTQVTKNFNQIQKCLKQCIEAFNNIYTIEIRQLSNHTEASSFCLKALPIRNYSYPKEKSNSS